VRLKAKKEKRDAERKRREEEKWRVPPLRYEKKAQSRPTTTRTNQCPAKPALRKSPSMCNSARSRSASPAKKKHVSWAPSTSTLDRDGNLTTEPLEGANEHTESSDTPPVSSLQEPPAACQIHPHTSISIEERSARGQELIGAMSPKVVSRWAQSHG
jgi:hypothetical protein